MVGVSIAEPGELSEVQLVDAEMLVRNAFGSEFRSHDWLHAVEGVHIVLTEDTTLMGFAAVVARTLHYNGVAFDTRQLEAVRQTTAAGGLRQAYDNSAGLRQDRDNLEAQLSYRRKWGDDHELTASLSRELNVPVIDARNWMDARYLADGFHLSRVGAAEFTRRLGARVVAEFPEPGREP